MRKITKTTVMFSFLLVIVTGMPAKSFDGKSFSRQQSQADSGFDELDREFETPVTPPKVIIKEKTIIKERLVPAPPIVVVPSNKISNTSVRTQLSNGYLFTLKGCSLSNRNIECNLSVVREKDDGTITLYTNYDSNLKTSIFDNTGNQYHPDSISLGSGKNSSWVRSRLIRGIKTKINIYFSNVSSETSSIALLEVPGHDQNSDQGFNLQFRDVSFK